MYYIKHESIDKQKWDGCINSAVNSLIYARSFYLDSMCGEWDALIGENYQWVLPLTYRKKYGIIYLYQPAFTQQLGVFYTDKVEVPWQQISAEIKKHFNFWEINVNHATSLQMLDGAVSYKFSANFILDISQPYEIIKNKFHEGLKRNLKQSDIYNLGYEHATDEEALQLFKLLYAERISAKGNDFINFERLCKQAKLLNILTCRKAVNADGKLMASVILFNYNKRLYNIMPAITQEGRGFKANHFLMNEVIREFSEQNMLLDFEGSEIPGVKEFYKKFGAADQPYFRVKFNNLPVPWKWFKK